MFKYSTMYKLLGQCLISAFLACNTTINIKIHNNEKHTKMANAKPVYIDNENIEADPTPVYWQAPANYAPQIRYPYTYQQTSEDIEPGGGISMTIPNETYTIRELLEKHTRGVMPLVQQDPQYGEDDVTFDSPDLQQVHQMDLYDVQQHLSKTKKLIEQLDENYKSQQHIARQQQVKTDENEVKVKKDNVENEQK